MDYNILTVQYNILRLCIKKKRDSDLEELNNILPAEQQSRVLMTEFLNFNANNHQRVNKVSTSGYRTPRSAQNVLAKKSSYYYLIQSTVTFSLS